MLFSGSYRSNDDDSDGGVGAIAIVWGVVVVAPYFAIKHRYKNVTHVLSNPIKTWDTQVYKNLTYKKKDYVNKYPNDDLKRITFQKFMDGKYLHDIDINRMVSDSNSVLKNNYTVNNDEL